MDIVINIIIVALIVIINLQLRKLIKAISTRKKTVWTGQTKKDYEKSIDKRKARIIVMNDEHEQKALHGINIDRW